MKTEKQVEARLETMVNAFVEHVQSIGDTPAATEEQKIGVASQLAAISGLAWVLDQEAEMNKLLSHIKLAEAVNNLASKGM